MTKGLNPKRARRVYRPFALLALIICVALAQSAAAYETAKRFGKTILVKEHFRVAFADTDLQKYRPLLEHIVRDFNRLPCGPQLEVASAQNADILIQWGELPDTFAAQTQRKLKGRRLQGATITLNADFSFIEQANLPLTQASAVGTRLEKTLRHEVGHALGLEHSRKRNTLMHAAMLESGEGGSFAFDDLMGFCHLYQD